MTIGIIPTTLTIANDQPWVEDVRFWLDIAKTMPATINDAQVYLKSQTDASTIFPLTVANGRIVINGGIVGIRVTAADMATIPPDTYSLEIKATDSSTYVRQIRGIVSLVQGLGF